MAEQSDRMGFPYPSEFRDHYYPDFESFVRSLDASGFASREDRNLFFLSEGDFTFEASTGLLTWAQEIDIFVATTGQVLVVAPGSVNLALGQVLYVDLVRGSTVGGVIAATVGSVIPSSDSAFILAFRFGSFVLFNNGRIIRDGEVGPVLAASSLFGAGTISSAYAPFADGGTTAIRDAVRVSAVDTIAKAQASAIASAPAVGFVVSKPTGTSARIQTTGELGGFVGLTTGALYYLSQSVAGGITLTPPSLPADLGTGKIVQRVGRARSTTTLMIQIDPDFLIL